MRVAVFANLKGLGFLNMVNVLLSWQRRGGHDCVTIDYMKCDCSTPMPFHP